MKIASNTKVGDEIIAFNTKKEAQKQLSHIPLRYTQFADTITIQRCPLSDVFGIQYEIHASNSKNNYYSLVRFREDEIIK